jgi:hypothetical protein
MTEAPRFTWSYSAINDYANCPLQYAHKRYYKDTPQEEAEHLIWGTRVHKVLEETLLGVAQADEENAKIAALYAPYTGAILAKDGEVLTEMQMAITEQMQPTEWFAPDAWGRGIIDAVVIKDGTAYIFDWKTGKVKNDDFQLRLFCAFLSIFRPDVERFIAKFIWLKFSKVTGFSQPITRDAMPKIWSDTLMMVRRMKKSWEEEEFIAKPSGLCPWCSYKSCLFKKER